LKTIQVKWLGEEIPIGAEMRLDGNREVCLAKVDKNQKPKNLLATDLHG
jgi:hypothetical protein